jgi:hypothetical protein
MECRHGSGDENHSNGSPSGSADGHPQNGVISVDNVMRFV